MFLKQALFCVFLCVIVNVTQAQYRCIPHLYEYGNPGGSPEDDYHIYNVNVGVAVTPVWLPVMSIGFPFSFNGQPVSRFKVSSTGVLTFDTLAATPPPFSNQLLPDPQVPDRSVCIRGISALLSASTIYPSLRYNHSGGMTIRQLWITFQQFSDTLGGNLGVIYSIVLEENTNNIYVVEQGAYPGQDVSLTIGVQIDQTNATLAPGSPNIGLHGPNGFSASDNVYYAFFPDTPRNTDGQILDVSLNDYLRISEAPFTLSVVFRNLGMDTVHSLQAHYSINGSSPVSQSFSGLSVPCGDILSVVFNTPFIPADTGVYILDFWTDAINGSSDQDTSNDHLLHRVYVAPDLPQRRILFEEFKGTWCTWSGYWTERYDSIIGLNFAKASSLKYEESQLNLSENAHSRGQYYNKWAVPTSYSNGTICDNDPNLYSGCPWNVTQAFIDSLYNLPGLFFIQPQLSVNGFTATVTGSVTSAVNFSPNTSCMLYMALVEDTIIYATPQGNSGETVFINTCRRFVHGNNGILIGSPHIGQTFTMNHSVVITDTTMNLSRLRVVVFVQDTLTKEIYQCAEAAGNQICPPVYHTTIHHICEGDSVFISGTWVSDFGSYPTIFPDTSGCDSMQLDIVRIHMVNPYANYVNGNLTSSVGQYIGDVITRQWYNVTTQQIVPGATGSTLTPTAPGAYALIASNQMGCTDTSNVVNVACLASFLQQTVNLCQGDSIQVGSRWISTQGFHRDTLLAANGCDSFVNTNVVLTVIYATINEIGGSLVCNSSGQKQWIDCVNGNIVGSGGNFYPTYNGIFKVRVTSSNGCIGESTCYPYCYVFPNYQSAYLCPGDSVQFGTEWYSSPGSYQQSLLTPFGCDSTLVLNLFQLNSPDTTVSLSGDSLLCHAGNAYYTWYDCTTGSIIYSGNQSFFIPPYSGWFKAAIFNWNGCSDTTSCISYIITGKEEASKPIEFILAPNPSTDMVTLTSSIAVRQGRAEIFDLTGKHLLSVSMNDSTAWFSVSDFAAGCYFIKIFAGDKYMGVKRFTVMK